MQAATSRLACCRDEIAQTLFLTPATVEDYLARVRRTLGVETTDELVREVSSPRTADRVA